MLHIEDVETFMNSKLDVAWTSYSTNLDSYGNLILSITFIDGYKITLTNPDEQILLKYCQDL